MSFLSISSDLLCCVLICFKWGAVGTPYSSENSDAALQMVQLVSFSMPNVCRAVSHHRATGSSVGLCHCLRPALWAHVTIESQKGLVWKGPESPPSPTPCCGQGCPPPAQAAQGLIQPGLERLQGWGTTASMGSCASASPPSEC